MLKESPINNFFFVLSVRPVPFRPSCFTSLISADNIFVTKFVIYII